MFKYRVGTVIECSEFVGDIRLGNMKGIIKNRRYLDYTTCLNPIYGIEFFEFVDGHSGNGDLSNLWKGKEGHCWNVSEDSISISISMVLKKLLEM